MVHEPDCSLCRLKVLHAYVLKALAQNFDLFEPANTYPFLGVDAKLWGVIFMGLGTMVFFLLPRAAAGAQSVRDQRAPVRAAARALTHSRTMGIRLSSTIPMTNFSKCRCTNSRRPSV